MQRFKLQELKNWKTSIRRKPLILFGARQVGKTWLLRAFGSECYRQTVYINFEDATPLQNLFATDFDIERIIAALQIHSHTTITPEDTLIILDEIQSAPRGLTALKYFCEQAPQYHVVAAGSLLGISLHPGDSFPVGKVNLINLAPLSFDEFLCAMGEQGLYEAIAKGQWSTVSTFHSRLVTLLKTYLYVGGMPEAVSSYVERKDLEEVRTIQKEILRDYEADFSKHAPRETVQRIRMVWQSLPSQLAKENRKFVFGILREGARAKDFEIAIQWLVEAGLVFSCHRTKEPRLPLVAYQELSVFKLFLHDVGLLSAMTGLDMKLLLEGDRIFTEFKGALTEQYVHQQLVGQEYIGYWTNDRSTAEVDFTIQARGKVIPVEVKADENVRSKSFRFFCEKFDVMDNY